MSTLRCENLHYTYTSGQQQTKAIRGINLSFQTGMVYSIIGRSGSGKSTLLHLLSGILAPSEGDIYYDDIRLNGLDQHSLSELRRKNTGIVFQNYQLLPELTVAENIILPSILDHRQPDMDWASKIMERLEISDIAGKHPSELSGGQQQRVSIGRAIMNRPPFLFADEPTGNLDKKTSENVLDFLLDIKNLYAPLLILVTHDLDIARSADTVLHIEDGALLNGGTL